MDLPIWFKNISFFSFPASDRPLLKYLVVSLNDTYDSDTDNINHIKRKVLITSFGIIISVAILSLAATFIEKQLFKIEFFWVSNIKHAVFETFGGIVSLIISLVLAWEYSISGARTTFALSLAFLAMGILDIFHAHADYCYNTFVWLHSSSAFLGALFLVGSTFFFGEESQKHQESVASRRFYVVLGVIILMLYSISIIKFYKFFPNVLETSFPHHTPVDQVIGNFTGFILSLNLFSSILYLIAGIIFIQSFLKTNDLMYLVFGSAFLLFFESELLFAFSKLWNIAWWFWHAIKLLIFLALLSGLAFGFTKTFYRLHTSRQMLAASYEEIAKTNRELNFAYKNLKETQKYLTQSEQLASIGKMAATLAHEIKNPLGAITTSIGVLTKYYNIDDNDRELVQIVESEMERLNKLVEDFLSFSRPNQLNKTETDLNQIIEESLSLLQLDTVINKNFSFQKNFSSDLPLLNVDKHRIKQLLINILLNAIQAIPQDGEVTIQTLYKQADDEVEISITDTGTGISEEVLPQVFQPFFTTKDKGLGLGLNIVYKSIKEHGGYITISSEKGKGTRVQFNLPVANTRQKNTGKFNSLKHMTPI
jgi:signal transduction histidine kinase